MKVYQGTKKVNAQPMTRGEYNKLRGWDVPKDENPDDEGYLVEYLDGGKANVPGYDGYVSWSPRDVFERAYLEVGEPVIPSDGPKVVYRDLIDMIESETFTLLPNTTTTICNLKLKNGYSVQGMSACVDPANYRENVGEFYSRKAAIEKLWPLAGFALAERIHQEKLTKGADWLDRLRSEFNTTHENLNKLKAFIAKLPEDFDEVAGKMLHEQARIMGEMENILALRLNHAVSTQG